MNTVQQALRFKRVFNSPIALVWKVYTQPEYILQWWSPKDMETTINDYEFREGGSWEYVMKMPNGMEFLAEGLFKEIQSHKKIVTTANFKPKTEGIVLEVLFESNDDITEFTFNVVFPNEDYKIEQEKMGVASGWEAALDRLSEILWNLS